MDSWTDMLLKSGWTVHPENSLYFTSPAGFVYIRCGLDLHSRTRHQGEPDAVPLRSIFSAAEYESWRSNFIC